MRWVVYGAGAVGGLFGASLHEAGHDVALIARGPHLAAIQAAGLRMDTPTGSVTVAVPAVGHPGELELAADDVVFVTVKSQDTEDVLRTLAAVAPPGIAVVSVQNGVVNEPAALRWFADVYGMCVYCPAVHLEPGVVEVGWAPVRGILDVGRYPDGIGGRTQAIADAVGSTPFDCVARPDIMRWKYGKLVMNLTNAIDALCRQSSGPLGLLAQEARAEAEACLASAGIAFVGREETAERRKVVVEPASPRDRSGPGMSSWQSLARGTGSIEIDYLNGEIVRLGREHGVATPVNEGLQRIANRAAREGWAAGSMDPDELIRRVRDGE